MSRRILVAAILVAVGPAGLLAAPAGPPIKIINIMIGTNKIVETSQRIGRAEVTGEEFCRVKYEQNGTALELFPIKNGKTRVWIFDAFESRPLEELRINVCSRDTIDMYDKYAASYRGVEGLVVDIQENRLVFSGQIFSMNAYKDITAQAPALGFSTEGLELHPYVNAVLAEPLSAIGPPPTRDTSGGGARPTGP